MTDNLPSKQPSQAELFTSADMPASLFADEELAETRGTFTGERLFAQNPDKYWHIVQLLGEMMPVNRIARLLNVSWSTVDAVRTRQVDAIEEVRMKAGRRFRRVQALALDHIEDQLADGERTPALRDLVNLATSANQAAQLLEGAPTARTESVVVGDPGIDEFNAEMERMRCIDVESTLLASGKEPSQKKQVEISDDLDSAGECQRTQNENAGDSPSAIAKPSYDDLTSSAD